MTDRHETDAEISRAARDAVVAGGDIRREIRDIVARAVAGRSLEQNSLRHVLKLVLKGVTEGLPEDAGEAHVAVHKAGEGIEDAAEHVAEALQLAIEEARSRGDEFTEHDLKHAAEDLAALDRLYIETMHDFAKAGATTAQKTIADLAMHLERSGGKAAGALREATETLEQEIAASGRPHLSDVNRAARTGIGTIAALGSAILGGIAEGLAEVDRPSQSDESQSDEAKTGKTPSGDTRKDTRKKDS
ncbi:DUF6781 family protein [Celeribacter persicus]|uniref:Uncharacterized protein n=1 Tax=Celeribacter persicus TaxID=1651082 RepID=A0A2T5H0H3_9RHOB|nr:DUF6781 family protein [Celeribacter persicus]PTQ65071.1 hypothetical protein C8N42_1372 [Celeribacter persicus]